MALSHRRFVQAALALTASGALLGIGMAPAMADAGSAPTGPILTGGGSTYDGAAAASWASAHSNDTQPFDAACTWFASNALWAGSLPQDPQWNSNGSYGTNYDLGPVHILDHKRNGTPAANAVIDLLNYLTNTYPATYIEPLTMTQNNVPDAQPGDLILYVWDGDPGWGYDGDSNLHLAVVTGDAPDNPQYPEVAEWGDQRGGSAHFYQNGTRGWTWSANNSEWLQGETGQSAMTAYLVHIDTSTPATY